MGSPARLGAVALAVPLVASLGVALAAGASGATSTATAPATACGTSPVQAGQAVDGVTLDPAQLSDARVIYDVSVTMGLPQHAAVIAEATAMQESGLVNLPDGTSDSLGLFQQRPSQGWGTPAQIMQPVYAATRFYEALASVPGWQSLPLTVAAQAVQGSATPGAYAKWESLADSLVATFSGERRQLPHRQRHRRPPVRHHPPPRGVHPARRYPAGRRHRHRLRRRPARQALHLGRGRPGRLRLLRPGHDGLRSRRHLTPPDHVPAGLRRHPGLLVQPTSSPATCCSRPAPTARPQTPATSACTSAPAWSSRLPQTGEDIEITPFSGYWQENTVAIRRIV